MDQLVTFKVHIISNIYIPHLLSCPGPLPILVLLLKNYCLHTEGVRSRRERQRRRRKEGQRRREGQRKREGGRERGGGREGGTEEEEEGGTEEEGGKEGQRRR